MNNRDSGREGLNAAIDHGWVWEVTHGGWWFQGEWKEYIQPGSNAIRFDLAFHPENVRIVWWDQ